MKNTLIELYFIFVSTCLPYGEGIYNCRAEVIGVEFGALVPACLKRAPIQVTNWLHTKGGERLLGHYSCVHVLHGKPLIVKTRWSRRRR